MSAWKACSTRMEGSYTADKARMKINTAQLPIISHSNRKVRRRVSSKPLPSYSVYENAESWVALKIASVGPTVELTGRRATDQLSRITLDAKDASRRSGPTICSLAPLVQRWPW